jgi:hypothetical protein
MWTNSALPQDLLYLLFYQNFSDLYHKLFKANICPPIPIGTKSRQASTPSPKLTGLGKAFVGGSARWFSKRETVQSVRMRSWRE